MASFDKAIIIVLTHEGGYVNDPSDSGGETNFGICKRDNPQLDIRHLTKDTATAWYKTNWWDKYGFQRINDDELASYMFDHAVNVGMTSMTKCVQQVIGVTVDGQIGPQTIGAINSMYMPSMLITIQDALWRHYVKILAVHPEDEKFRKGWHSRCYSI